MRQPLDLNSRVYVAEIVSRKGNTFRLRFDYPLTPEQVNHIVELYGVPHSETIRNCGVYDLYVFQAKPDEETKERFDEWAV